MAAVPLLKLRNYFITDNGIVFKIEQGKEVRVPTRRKQTSKAVLVLVDGTWRELLYLMIEHFKIKYTPYDKLRYKITDDLRIERSSIKVKPFMGTYGISESEEKHLFKYDCNIKAHSANQRCPLLITPVQVYYTLKIHEFKCVYCSDKIKPHNWHLDHFIPLARNGQNVFENIVPSCPTCNIMKGALDGNQFVKMCKKVAEAHRFELPHVFTQQQAKVKEMENENKKTA